MRTVVIDASMAAAWLLPDEWTEATDAVWYDLSGATLLVPSIFWHEMRNILIVAERRKRIDADQAYRLLTRLDLLNLQDAGHGPGERTLAFARTYGLTAYDAVYLGVTMAIDAGSATLDRKLASAARRENIPLLGPLAL